MTNDDDHRERDTMPTPSDPPGRLAHDMAELQLALGRIYECLAKVEFSMSQVALAELTVEHRQNVQRQRLVAWGRVAVDHERRLRVLEGLGEPAAAE